MLRELRHRRQRGLARFLGVAVLLVFALRGLVAAAPLSAFAEARANGQTAICTGSAVILVTSNGETRHLSIDSCADCLTAGAAPPPSAARTPPPPLDKQPLHARNAKRPVAEHPRRAHPARAPPLT